MGNCLNSNAPAEQLEDNTEQPINRHVSEISDVLTKYRLGMTLGRGASCQVYAGYDKEDESSKVAIKVIDKDFKIAEKLFKREVKILDILTPNKLSPNPLILPFIGYGEDKSSYYVITNLLTGGEVFERIVTKTQEHKITEFDAIRMVKQMLKSIQYCHSKNVIHRDLKPENFVLENKKRDSNIILIDFGCARCVEDDEVIQDVIGTAYYIAPELASQALANYEKKGAKIDQRAKKWTSIKRTGKILKSSDLWSIGIIAYVMMTGRAPFRGRDNKGIFESICLKPLIFPEKDARYKTQLNLNSHFKDFVESILQKNPEKRITMEKALIHPWIQGVNVKDYILNKDVIYYLKQFKYE